MYSDESEEGDDNVNEEPTDKVTDGPHDEPTDKVTDGPCDHEDTLQDNVMDQQDSDGAASHHAPVQPQISQPGPLSEAPHQPCLADSCSHDPHNPPQSLSKESIQNPPEPFQYTPCVPLTHNLPDRLTDPHGHDQSIQNPPEPLQCTPHVPLTHNLPDRLTDPHGHDQSIQNPPEPLQCTPHVPLTHNLPDHLTDPHSHDQSIQNPPEPLQHTPRVPLTHDLPEQPHLESHELSHEPIVHTEGWHEPTEFAIAPFLITCMLMKSKNVSGSLTTTTMWEGQGGIQIGKDNGEDTKTHTTTT
ncbi:hypothetical protein EDB19DRAFT_1833821 [Suillus lakei]|nr:hypothetical protein EDB19DRAFT_1833821 [Suillus lakei]